MPDYQQSKIYKIVSPDIEECYVGSTTTSLSCRMAQHRRMHKRWVNGKGDYTSSYAILDYGNAVIILIENYPCNSKEELIRKEYEIMRSVNCVNIVKTDSSLIGLDKDDYNRKYRALNIEKNIQYRKNNPEKFKQYNKNQYEMKKHEKKECECGSVVRMLDFKRHEKSKKHQAFLAGL